MCGRYALFDNDNLKEILDILEETERDLIYKTGEIFPTNNVPVITAAGKNGVKILKWGFPQFKGNGQIINARAETILIKPMFKNSFVSRRCLIPASGFYEWKQEESKKIKHIITANNSQMFFMGGIYNTFKIKDSDLAMI